MPALTLITTAVDASLPQAWRGEPASYGGWEDARVLRDIATGSEPALREIYDRFSPKLYGGALLALQNAEDAREVVQDWLVRVWEKADQYDAHLSAVGTWLTMIFRGLVANKLRSRSRRISPVSWDALPDVSAAPEALPTLELEQIFGQFTEEERRYLDAAVFTCRTHEELAADFQEPLGTVKSRIRRALEKLKQLIKQEIQP